MPEVVTTVETAAEVAAPVVNAGTIDYKKALCVAGVIVGVAASAYICKKIIDKRKEEKIVVTINPEPAEEPVVEAEEPEPAPKKTKAKK